MVQLRIKELCKEQRITINGLAEKIGVAQPTISRIINGKQTPALDTLEKIADALGVEVAELFRPADKAKIVCPYCGKTISLTPDKA